MLSHGHLLAWHLHGHTTCGNGAVAWGDQHVQSEKEAECVIPDWCDILCFEGKTELLGACKTQGHDAVMNPGEGDFIACIMDDGTGGSTWSMFDDFCLELVGGPHDGLCPGNADPCHEDELKGEFVEHPHD